MFGPRVELPGGLLLKQIGKVAQFGGPDDQDPNTFGARIVLEKVAVDPRCDQYVMTPARGHRLVLSFQVETSAVFQPDHGRNSAVLPVVDHRNGRNLRGRSDIDAELP
jgi:hypothetical protein